MDSKTVNEFLEDLFKSNNNQVGGDSAAHELFSEKSPFRIICKCGSYEIEIIGERGYMISEETGWQDGSTVIKCKKCGAAITAWG